MIKKAWEDMDLTVSGVRYSLTVQGEGPLLLLFHGFTGTKATWSSYMDNWSRSYKVAAIDMIGHGKTDAPKDSAPYKMENAVEAAAAIIKQLSDEPVYAAGYSMGGRFLLHLVSRFPELFKKIVLESASPGLKTEQERAARRNSDEQLAAKIEREGIESFVDYWENIPMFESQKKLSRGVQETVRKERLSQLPAGLAGSLRGMGTGAQAPLWPVLRDLHLPVCLVTGSLDAKFLKINDEMNKTLENSVWHIVGDSGHAPHVEQFEKFDKIVMEFFNS